MANCNYRYEVPWLRDIWDAWSKQSHKYNTKENEDHWRYNPGIIDINFLVWDLRRKGVKIEYVSHYQEYEPITKNVATMTNIEFNSKILAMALRTSILNNTIPLLFRAVPELVKQRRLLATLSNTPTRKPNS